MRTSDQPDLAADNVPVQRASQISELMSEGITHHHARRLGEAVDCYSRVTAMLPDHGEAWRLLGVVALQTGDTAASRSLLERALRIDANDAGAYAGLGSVNEAEGLLDAAYAAFQAASAIDPTLPSAAAGLVRAALGLGRAREAIVLGEAAIANGMSDARLLRTLGAAHLKLREFAGALDASLASVRITPHADAYANAAAAFIHLGRVDASIAACADALALDPLHAEATNNLGIARKVQASFPAALAAFERAAALGSEDAHLNLGTTRLLLGDYRGGWPQYGWVSADRQANAAFASLPMWDGTPARGQRLLIWPEQGIGDTIQMARFVRRARALVGSVTLACPPGTIELLRTLDGADAFIESTAEAQLDRFDVWLPTIRLPVVFDIARESIPGAPYLRADQRRIEHFPPTTFRRPRAPTNRPSLVG